MGARYEFIVNPQARSGRGKKIWERMEPELKRRNIDFGVHITKKKGHAGKIADRLSAPGQQRTIVVMGGDGTVNEVLNGLNISENITLGYIPVGSGNDFARGLGIPEKPEKALRTVLSPKKIVRMDVGVLSDGVRTRRFGVSGGMGFDASVCHAVSVSRWKKILNRLHLGKLTYAVVAVGTLLRNKPVRAELTMESGKKQVFDRLVFAAFMNLPCEGGGFRFCPDAAPDDGGAGCISGGGNTEDKDPVSASVSVSGRPPELSGNYPDQMPESSDYSRKCYGRTYRRRDGYRMGKSGSRASG